MTDNIIVQATLTGALGNLVIDGPNAAAYELATETIADQQVTWRKEEVNNAWIEGTFVIGAVRENVQETLAIWVNGPTTALVEQRVYELTRRLRQIKWGVVLLIDGVTQTWVCSGPADIAVKQSYEFLHAPTALVTAKVNRLPKKTLTGTFGTLTS